MKQRILFITPGLFKGGAETQLLKVARFLKSQKTEVMILSLKPIKFFDVELEKEGIRVVFLNNWINNFFSNCITLFKTVKAFKADVVIAFMFIAIIFARLLKIWFRFKLISTIRISVIKKKWYLPFKITSGLDDAIVYNSYASKISFEKQKLVCKEGIVINNGISIPNLKVENSTKTDLNPFVWICVAHFKYNKDYLTLFKAIHLLKYKNIRLNIVGNLHDKTWPFKIIEELQIQDKVNLLGFKQNPQEYLEDADAFVLSSFSEGMPNAVLEAMAYSKPIVVTDLDCNEELVFGAHCGYLFKQGNEVELADKMLHIMNLNEEERKILGQNGRKYIENHFSEQKIMNDWLFVINRYLNSKNLALNS